MPSFRCADLGMKCNFEIKNGSSRDEVMQMAALHAKNAHGMATIPPELAPKVSAAIH
jgi:predicted small metal-binding protein